MMGGSGKGGPRIAPWAAGLLLLAACGGSGAGSVTTQAPAATTATSAAPATTLPPADTTTTSEWEPDDVGIIEGECPFLREDEVKTILGRDDIGLVMVDLEDIVGPAGETLEGYAVCSVGSADVLIFMIASDGTGIDAPEVPARFEGARTLLLEGSDETPPAGEESPLAGVGVEAYRYDQFGVFQALARRGGSGYLLVTTVLGADGVTEAQLVTLIRAALAR